MSHPPSQKVTILPTDGEDPEVARGERGLRVLRQQVPSDTTIAARVAAVRPERNEVDLLLTFTHAATGAQAEVGPILLDYRGADIVVIEAGDHLPTPWPPASAGKLPEVWSALKGHATNARNGLTYADEALAIAERALATADALLGRLVPLRRRVRAARDAASTMGDEVTLGLLGAALEDLDSILGPGI